MSYSPNESSEELWLERSTFVGSFLGVLAYGILTVLYFRCAYVLICRRREIKIGWFWLGYITLLYSIATLQVGASTKFNQMIWIDDREFPGGPAVYIQTMWSLWINTLNNVAYIVNNFLADGLLLYRCFIIWKGYYYVTILPTLMFLISTVLSILTIYQGAQPGASIWTTVTFSFAVPWWSISIALNILITIIIVTRIVWHHRELHAVMGSEYGRPYTPVIATVVESAALYSTVGMIYIICYARNSNVQNLVLPVLSQVMVISPTLIILRVAYGRAIPSTRSMTNTGVDFHFNQSEAEATETTFPVVSVNGKEIVALQSSGDGSMGGSSDKLDSPQKEEAYPIAVEP